MLLELNIDAQEGLFGLITCIVAFTVCVFFAFRRFARYRIIADTPTALIRSAPQGYVELIGKVIAGEAGLLDSPLSGSQCVWFDARIDRYKRNSNGKGGHWEPVFRKCSDAWFQIDDDTGICLIDPTGAEANTRQNRVWYGATEWPGALHNYSFEHYSISIVGGNSRYRYTEKLITEGEPLYALGNFHSVGGGRDRLDLQAASRNLLKQWKSDQAALIDRFDTNSDGKIDMNEWSLAQNAALKQAKAHQRELDTLPTMHALRDPQAPGLPFILSTFDEGALIKRFRWHVAGFMACALLAFWLGLELLLTETF
ncbi:MAG: hypothetical protein GYB21_12480 [Oceanospirillales bacterium]|nr:hypothetical protein [Oceanospirillales bacterium]